MEPKILLVMDKVDQFSLNSLHSEDSPYTFIDYKGSLTLQAVENHLKNQNGSFDAVAVFALSSYDGIRKIVEGNFEGPKILVKTKLSRYQAREDLYLMEVTLPIEPSEFDKLVEKQFKHL
ncbi:hypothetical protein KY339_00390 [Candidatus Woesearchaeota archaeon]|nr:hypothetical protein [Candidatus Woesearchaeota archaeon]